LNFRKQIQTHENGSNKESLLAKDIEFDPNSNKSTLVSLLEKQLTTEVLAGNITTYL
jgi:hypothetical protein